VPPPEISDSITHTSRHPPSTTPQNQQINKFTGVPSGVRQGGRPAADHYCEYCGVWMKNHPRVIQMHEQAAPHKAAVSKSEALAAAERGRAWLGVT
jgi:hypothetical protein